MSLARSDLDLLRHLSDHHPCPVLLSASYGDERNHILLNSLSVLRDAGLVEFRIRSFRYGLEPLPNKVGITDFGLSYIRNCDAIS